MKLSSYQLMALLRIESDGLVKERDTTISVLRKNLLVEVSGGKLVLTNNGKKVLDKFRTEHKL